LENKINVKLTVDTQGVVSELKEVANVIQNIKNQSSDTQSGSFLSGLSSAFSSANAVYGAFQQIKDVAASIVMPGFDFTKDMEVNQLGIAGILQSMTLLNGQAVSFGDAMNISADMMGKLQMDAIKTSTSTKDLVTTFKDLLTPGIDAGMNLEQIRQFTTAGVTVAKAKGLDSAQVAPELQNLIEGNVQSSSLAKSMGLTDEDIEQAKQSSEGLFNFLMERMQTMMPMAEQFPNTLEGNINKLKEVSTLASAEITKAFADDFKEIVSAITDMIADVNTETGEIEINPEIMGFVYDLKQGWNDLTEFLNDALPQNGVLMNDLTGTIQSLYNAVINVAEGMMDFLRVLANSEMIQRWATFIRNIANEVEWLTKKFREFYDERAKSLGVKEEKSESTVAWWSGLADKLAPKANTSNVINKYPNRSQQESEEKVRKEAFKEAKEQMNLDIKETKLYFEDKIKGFKVEKETLEKSRDPNGNIQDYYQKLAQMDQNIVDAKIASVAAQIDIVSNTPFENDKDKKGVLDTLNSELKNLQMEAQGVSTAFSEISSAVKVSGDDIIAAAESRLGTPYGDKNSEPGKLVCTQLVVESWKDAGIPFANGASEWVPTLIDQAKEAKLWRDGSSGYIPQKGDGIVVNGDSHIGVADGNGGIYHASSSRDRVVHDSSVENAFGTPTGYIDISQFTNSSFKVKTQDMSKKFYEEYQKMLDEGNKMFEQAAAIVGDISSLQKKDIEEVYNNLIQKFEDNKKPGFARAAEKVKASKLLNLDFSQTQKDLEYANNDLVEYQETLYGDMAKGSKTSAEATQDYIDKYHSLFDDKLKDLQNQLEKAKVIGDKDAIVKINNAIKNTMSTLINGIEAFIKRIDDEMNDQISRINANRKMTSRQKEDAIDVVRRNASAEKADKYQKEANNLSKSDFDNKTHEQIIKLNEQAELNRKLAEMPTLLDKIHEASTQAFEDGLLDFLQRGILECNSLGEAFKNLANSVLQSIQKVYAEALTKDIMKALGLGGAQDPWSLSNGTKLDSTFGIDLNNLFNFKNATAKTNQTQSLSDSTKFDPTFGIDLNNLLHWKNGGHVNGEGTSTSDSILAKLSNGEFVINAAAVKKVGTDFLERVNSGDIYNLSIPMLKFARGGAVGSTGADSAAKGIDAFTANIGNSVSTTVPVNIMNRIDPKELFEGYGSKWIVNEFIRNGKLFHQMSNRYR
jgi:cell wall-associated NlpC family hydrolase